VDAERRAHYLALFESWLDRALADEGPPEGVDPGLLAALDGPSAGNRGPDLHTLFQGLTALTQEVKLQGRAFKGLSDAVWPLLERVDGVAGRHDEALEEARRLAEEARDIESTRVQEAEERSFEASLGLLFDLRDRLARGVAAAEALLAEASRSRRLGRLWPSRDRALTGAVSALLDGHRLTLDHLDDALRSRGVSPIECLGRDFEPGRMSAVDVVHTSEAEDGAVVEIYRAGYEWNGLVLRAAEVKVARRPEGGSSS
jgi:molecular chaperone GrpE